MQISVSYHIPQTVPSGRLSSDPLIGRLLMEDLKDCQIRSEYYDSPGHVLRAAKATLRIERRAGVSCAYLNRLTTAEEAPSNIRYAADKADLYESWQCEADDINAAAGVFTGMGAPAFLTGHGEEYRALGQYEFTRQNAALMIPCPEGAEDGGAAIFISFDNGVMTAGAKRGELDEMSLKLLYGHPGQMLELAAALEQKYGLKRVMHTRYERLLSMVRSRK